MQTTFPGGPRGCSWASTPFPGPFRRNPGHPARDSERIPPPIHVAPGSDTGKTPALGGAGLRPGCHARVQYVHTWRRVGDTPSGSPPPYPCPSARLRKASSILGSWIRVSSSVTRSMSDWGTSGGFLIWMSTE